MPIGHRLSKGSGIPPECMREYVSLTDEISGMGINAVLAGLLGFTEQPPSPGAAADWRVDDWLAFGSRNAMTDVTRVKHGTMIAHNFLPRICVVPSGTPGDVRAGMNCAADFRRAYRRELGILKTYFQWMMPAVTTRGLMIDGRSPTPAELAKAVCSMSLADDERVLIGLGLDGFVERIDEDIEINVAKAYAAMTYLAGAFTPARSYPQVLLDVCETMSLSLSRDKAGMITKRIGQAYRTKERLVIPVAWSMVIDQLIDAAADAKEQVVLDRELRRAERVVEAEKRVAAADPVAVVRAAVAKIGGDVADTVTKLGYEIAQLSAKFEKVKAEVAAVEFDDVEALMQAQVKRANDAEAGVQLVESALQAKRGVIEDIAKVCGIDPSSADFESELIAKVVSLRDVAASAERTRKHHVDFASKVHDKLSVKDFLSIAASINELLPEAERIALSGGEED